MLKHEYNLLLRQAFSSYILYMKRESVMKNKAQWVAEVISLHICIKFLSISARICFPSVYPLFAKQKFCNNIDKLAVIIAFLIIYTHFFYKNLQGYAFFHISFTLKVKCSKKKLFTRNQRCMIKIFKTIFSITAKELTKSCI